MSQPVVIFETPEGPDVSALEAPCRQEGLAVERRTLAHDGASADGFAHSLEPGRILALAPALIDDCGGVKLAQAARAHRPEALVALYDRSLPEASYVAMAFREGAADVLALEGPAAVLNARVARLARLLGEGSADQAPAADRATLTGRIETLERETSRWQERLVMLASSAERLATGELRIDERSPSLLIVAASATQAAAPQERARQLGFRVQTVASGAEALARVETDPPDVVLSDATLDSFEAPEFARQLRKRLGRRPVILIGWSSSPHKEDLLLGPDGGFDDFVPKAASGDSHLRLIGALLAALR